MIKTLGLFIVFITLLFSGLTASNVAKPDYHWLSYKVTQEPILYGGSFYIPLSNKLIKTGINGQKEWEIPINVGKVSHFDVRFNRIYMINQKGQISCYDATYGFKIWGPLQQDIRQSLVRYPQIVVLDAQHKISALDFYTGQPIWEDKTLSWDRVYDTDHSKYIFAMKERSLFLLNTTTSDIYMKLKLSFIPKHIYATRNNIFLQDNNNSLYQLDLSKKKISIVSYGESQHFVMMHQKNALFRDKKSGNLVVYHLPSGKMIWEKGYPQADRLFQLWPKSGKFAVGTQKKLDILDISQKISSENMITLIPESDCDMIQIYQYEKRVIGVCPNQILSWKKTENSED